MDEDDLWCNYSGMPSTMSYMRCDKCDEVSSECKCKEKRMNKEQQIRLIKTQEELNQYMEEVRVRGKSFEPNPTTVSFGDEDAWDINMEPYDFNKEYIKVTRTDNHEIIERVKYEQHR